MKKLIALMLLVTVAHNAKAYAVELPENCQQKLIEFLRPTTQNTRYRRLISDIRAAQFFGASGSNGMQFLSEALRNNDHQRVVIDESGGPYTFHVLTSEHPARGPNKENIFLVYGLLANDQFVWTTRIRTDGQGKQSVFQLETDRGECTLLSATW